MAAADDADLCPLCGRPLGDGPNVDRHHVIPKSEGGRQTVRMHRICHLKIHSLFDERELAREFADIERLRAHPEIRRFIEWVRRRPPHFHARTAPTRDRRKRRRRFR
jgi:hypothetical protein